MPGGGAAEEGRGGKGRKILYVISDRNVGGAGIQLCGLLRNLDRRRFDPVVALPYGSALRARLLALRVPVHELEHPCSRVSAASASLRSISTCVVDFHSTFFWGV